MLSNPLPHLDAGMCNSGLEAIWVLYDMGCRLISTGSFGAGNKGRCSLCPHHLGELCKMVRSFAAAMMCSTSWCPHTGDNGSGSIVRRQEMSTFWENVIEMVRRPGDGAPAEGSSGVSAVVTAVGPSVILHVRVRYRSLNSNKCRYAETTQVVSSPFVPRCWVDIHIMLVWITCICWLYMYSTLEPGTNSYVAS
jgi:hypothetical protein